MRPKTPPKRVVPLPNDVHELIVHILKGSRQARISAASAQLLYQEVIDSAQWGRQVSTVYEHTRGRYVLRPNISFELFADTGMAARAVSCFSVLPSPACHDASPAHRLVAIMGDGSIYTEYTGRTDDLHLAVR